MGLEILHAWNKVSESPPIVDIHFAEIEPWSRMAIETEGEPIWARTSDAGEFAGS